MSKTAGSVILLPPAPHLCQACAIDHEPDQPHNQQSLHYQYWFYGQHGRWPTWTDAMAHCSEEVQKFWREALIRKGIAL